MKVFALINMKDNKRIASGQDVKKMIKIQDRMNKKYNNIFKLEMVTLTYQVAE